MANVKLWRHDYIEGIWRRGVYMILPVMAALFSCITLHHRILENQNMNINVSCGTFMDYWIYLVQGNKPYKFDLYNTFSMPVQWMCLLMFVLIGLNNYPTSDLYGWGYQILVHSKSRLSWWMSKIVWLVGYTVTYYFICGVTVLGYCISNGAALKLHPSADIMHVVSKMKFVKCDRMDLMLIFIVIPVLFTLFLGTLQLLVGISSKPIYALIVSFVILLVSAYSKRWYLVGNFGMPYRVTFKAKTIFQPKICMAVLFAGIVLFIVVGYQFFRKMDIFERNEKN